MRRLVFPALALAMSLALAACGGSGGSTTTPTQPTATSGAASPPAESNPPASAATACAGTEDAATVDASIADFAFSPQTVEAKVGDVVAWTNEDSAPHSVVVGSDCRTGNLPQGMTGALVFNEPGTYSFVCGIHPTMTGTVEVTE